MNPAPAQPITQQPSAAGIPYTSPSYYTLNKMSESCNHNTTHFAPDDVDAIRKQIEALQLQQKQLEALLAAKTAASSTAASTTTSTTQQQHPQHSSPFAEPPGTHHSPHSHPVPLDDSVCMHPPPPEPATSPRQPLTPEQEQLVARINRLHESSTTTSTASADVVTLEPPPPSFTVADSQGQVVPPAVLRSVPRSTVRAELSSSTGRLVPAPSDAAVPLHTDYSVYHAPEGHAGGYVTTRGSGGGVPARQESTLREGSKLVAKSLRGTVKGAAKLWFTLADKADEYAAQTKAERKANQRP